MRLLLSEPACELRELRKVGLSMPGDGIGAIYCYSSLSGAIEILGLCYSRTSDSFVTDALFSAAPTSALWEFLAADFFLDLTDFFF